MQDEKPRGVRVGIPPFGFSWLRGRLVVNAEEIETVRLIIKLWQDGMTYTAIASHLNGHGIKTRKHSIRCFCLWAASVPYYP
ncbi:MAG TPA: hypothetical protein DCS07_16585 [Bdellovibrionales bacterium]|nr:hypothetical protein [Bdellovibrionales bacterium]HCM39037.1 hypothetical protein [Bdellovibrionales bacterium]